MLLVLLEKVQRNEDLLMVDYDMMGANVMIGFCVMRIECVSLRRFQSKWILLCYQFFIIKLIYIYFFSIT